MGTRCEFYANVASPDFRHCGRGRRPCGRAPQTRPCQDPIWLTRLSSSSSKSLNESQKITGKSLMSNGSTVPALATRMISLRRPSAMPSS